MHVFTISDVLAHEVLTSLGTTTPTDRASVDDLYRRFCATVPFDPIMKAVAVKEGFTPPGSNAAEVAERFLATGVGGTCWANCGLLAALFQHAGIDATIGLERMIDRDEVDFHCFVVIHLDGERLLADPIHVSGAPFPMRVGARGIHPAYTNAIAADDRGGENRVARHERLLHVWNGPEHGGRYVVLDDALDPSDVAAFCAVSVQHTGVRASRLFQRTATTDSVRIVKPASDGHGLEVREWRRLGNHSNSLAVEATTAHGPEGVMAALRINPDGLDLLLRSGLALRRGDAMAFAPTA